MTLDPHVVASDWLSLCSPALSGTDIDAVVRLLLPDGWLRDILVFTWDFRSLEGHDKVSTYLTDTLARAHITDICLSETAGLVPKVFTWPQLQATGVQCAFTFECQHGHGRGFARLLRGSDGVFRAYTLLIELVDLVGHEELGTLRFRDDLAGGDATRAIPMQELNNGFAKWKYDVETNPHVLIVGAAQTGLQIAARFKQMNIPTLAIDRAARIGDIWRGRHPSLALHTTRTHHSFLYQPYPTNWPEFTPRDKMADWIEHYAFIQDVVVWMKTEFKRPPTYDFESQSWDVTVVRDGVDVKLRPSHIVLATGTAGKPKIPDIPNKDGFHGQIFHSSRFPGGAAYAGKRAVVVGAGSSSMDICEDLAHNGAKSVTMIQRSSSCAVSRHYQRGILDGSFPKDLPLSVMDFNFTSMPYRVLTRLMIAAAPAGLEFHKEMHAKLRKGGLKANLGPEGQGIYPLYVAGAGGYWMDKGGLADMFEDGRIQGRNGVSLARFLEDAVVLDDGSELPADVVVFANGYVRIREVNKEVMGEEVINQTDEVFGLDEEGEMKGSYRPCGYPGLWFATGDFGHARSMSKHLALQIKAIELGLLKHNGRRDGAVDNEPPSRC